MRRIIFTLTLILFLVPGLCLADDLTRETQILLLKVRDTVNHVERELAKKRSVSTDFNTLKSLAEELRVNHLLLKDRFETRQQTVNTLGPKAIDRHTEMLREYNRVIERLLTILDAAATEKVLTSDMIKKLKTLLENIAPKRPNPIYGNLPYRHLNYALKAPLSGTTIVPAYLGGDKTVKDEDLASTSLAPISKTIAEKAQELQWNPVLIYEWVKNNVESEWYWGVQKGAEETLRQKSGNDADQACLLVALLRASGYPSRYMRGTMETFPNWQRFKVLIGIQSEQDLLAFFRKAGIPAKSVIAGGKISKIQIEHIWVESQIPYANYRGVVIDTHGKTWLGLDTHIKTKDYEVKPAKPWPETLDIRNIRDQYLSQVQTQTPLEFLQNYINTWLGLNQPGTTYQDLLETRAIIPDILKILPAGMQITPIAIIHEYEDLPDELIHQVQFKARDQADNIFFDATLPAWKLSNQKVTLTYEPETIEDQEIINSYGGLDNTPAYLVRLRPVLKIKGERTIIGEAGLPMGADYTVDMDLISPNGTERISNTHIMGNLTVIGIVSQQALGPKEVPIEEQDAEYLLHKEAMNYIRRWNQAEEELGSLLNLSVTRAIPTIATLGGVIEVDYLLGKPHRFTFKGIYMDADLRAIELVSNISAFRLQPSVFMQLAGLQGSILESRTIEEDFGIECISTAKFFGILHTQPANPPPVILDKTNIATILPTLSLPTNIKEGITNSVNQGFIVRTPQTELAYEDWTGTGYLVEKPSTGESGYMLSGQIAGSMSVQPPAEWPQGTLDALSHPFREPANKNPDEAYYILRIADNAEQRGTVGQKLSKPFQVMVLDKDKHPVAEANVTFTILAGNGSFDGAGRKTFETITDQRGIALTYLWIDQKITAPTVQWHEQDKKYPELVGENLVDAKLSNGTSLSRPFIGWAFPDRNNIILRKGCCDGTGNIIFNWARAIIAIVEDRYGNGLSNKEVIFSAQDATGGCQAGIGPHSAMLINEDADCIKNIPAFHLCQDQLQKELKVITCYGQARVQVFMGDVKNAQYVIKARIPDMEAGIEFIKDTIGPYETCDGEVPPQPINRFFLNTLYASGVSGTMQRGYPVGALQKFKLRTYFFNENPGPNMATVHIDCDNKPENGKEVSCDQYLVGSGTYTTTTNYEQVDINVTDGITNATLVEQATPLGDGLYEFEYKIKPNLNFLYVLGIAGVRAPGSVINCKECRIDPHYLHVSAGWAFLQLYGVEIKIQPVPLLMVNQYGDLMQDFKVIYQIEPPDYIAANAYALLFKDDLPIDYQTCSASQQGEANYYKGLHFEEQSKYQIQIVLNLGSLNEIRSEKVKLAAGKIYIQEKDPEFENSKLKPYDYYPNLGTKTIVIRGKDAQGGDLNTGKVRAELVYPPPNWDISKEKITLTPKADMVQGRAEIKLTVQPDVTPKDLESIELKFTYLVNDKDNGSVSGTWKVRNNSNVKMKEVLEGEAVFVFDDQAGPNHVGITPSGVTNVDQRYFDFVQELLNQVVSRKRSVAGYNLLDEQGTGRGIYNNTVAQVIGTFKDHFRVDNVGKSQGDFMKLLMDYNKTAEIETWRNRIADKHILVGTQEKPEDYLINDNTDGDTGLYELYKNVVVKIVKTMIDEEEQFRAYQGRTWRSRNNIKQGPGVVDGNGVSYCYGCKDDIQMFEDYVSGCTVPQMGTVPNNYRGNLNMDTCLIQIGQVYQYPGLWEDELNVSGVTSQYWPTYWSGIDCSGIVQRAMMKANRKYQIENDYKIRINVLELTVDHEKEIQRYEIGSGNFIIPDRSYEFAINNPRLLKKGDIIQYNGHVAMVYSERSQVVGNQTRYQIIHAYGVPEYTYPAYDLTRPNQKLFSRKIMVTWQNIANPQDFGRIKLWD